MGFSHMAAPHDEMKYAAVLRASLMLLIMLVGMTNVGCLEGVTIFKSFYASFLNHNPLLELVP